MERMELHAGCRVGNYILKEEIGRGAFGVVWRATHYERPDRDVAVKIATAPQYARQLRREARLRLPEHPNIVPLLDSDTLGPWPYVVMPFYPKGSLAELLRQHPAGMPEEAARQVLEDVLEGLSVAHMANVVHCDIKPSNILLTEDGRAALSDFGLARTPQASYDRSLIQSISLERSRDVLIGTLAYVAPEVLQGAEHSPASDVYSVGVVLFAMLTGRLPQGTTLPAAVRADLKDPRYWDLLYWHATSELHDRYCNATSMLLAVRFRPRPIPVADTPGPLWPELFEDIEEDIEPTGEVPHETGSESGISMPADQQRKANNGPDVIPRWPVTAGMVMLLVYATNLAQWSGLGAALFGAAFGALAAVALRREIDSALAIACGVLAVLVKQACSHDAAFYALLCAAATARAILRPTEPQPDSKAGG